jgi:hypothetical protein
MIRTSMFVGAAALASVATLSLGALPVAAQPADPDYQAQVQDHAAREQQYQQQVQTYEQKKQAYDAQRDAYARQRAGYRAQKDEADAQRQLWLDGLEVYEARYGRGSYDEYAHAHPDVTVVTPAGKVEQRGRTTVIETR